MAQNLKQKNTNLKYQITSNLQNHKKLKNGKKMKNPEIDAKIWVKT